MGLQCKTVSEPCLSPWSLNLLICSLMSTHWFYLSQYLHSDIMDGSFRYKPPLFIDLTKTSKIKGANRQLMPYSYPERRYQ